MKNTVLRIITATERAFDAEDAQAIVDAAHALAIAEQAAKESA